MIRHRKRIHNAHQIPNKIYPITEPNKLNIRIFFLPYLSLNAPKIGAARNVQAANIDRSALIHQTTWSSGRYFPTKKGKRGSTTDIPIAFIRTIAKRINNVIFFDFIFMIIIV
jgi:hypothetical protein